MNAECELIGRLLVHNEEIEDVRLSVTGEMFTQNIYKVLFLRIMNGETNPALLSESLINDYPNINQVIAECVNFSLTLKQCVDTIRKDYRARETVKLLRKYDIDGSNVDKVLYELSDSIEDLKPKLKSSGKTASELAKYKDLYFKPKGKRFHFGYTELDRLTGGIDKGDMCIIGARPAVGKSAFALNIINNNRDIKGGYFNLEMSEQQIFERWVCNDSGIDIGHLRRAEHANNEEQERLNEATENFKELKNVLFYTGATNVSKIYREVKQQGLQYVIIDYLQLMESEKKTPNRAEEVSSISRGLKKIATDFQIPVIALSQLNRLSEGSKDKEPSMAELRESGSLEQDASVVIILWKNESDDKRNVKVEKARMGLTGKMELYFDGAHMRFSEIDRKEIPFK